MSHIFFVYFDGQSSSAVQALRVMKKCFFFFFLPVLVGADEYIVNRDESREVHFVGDPTDVEQGASLVVFFPPIDNRNPLSDFWMMDDFTHQTRARMRAKLFHTNLTPCCEMCSGGNNQCTRLLFKAPAMNVSVCKNLKC